VADRLQQGKFYSDPKLAPNNWLESLKNSSTEKEIGYRDNVIVRYADSRVENETMNREDTKAVDALNAVIRVLNQLDEEVRTRVIRSVLTFFQTDQGRPSAVLAGVESNSSSSHISRPQFSDESNPTPKEFLLQKQPKTDVERIACLAYYLTQFRETPYFKTLDLSKLNTEAAQPKFSNARYAASNAVASGLLAPAPQGARQISAAGEHFVLALPDRDAARQSISKARRRKNVRRKK
jgi:hypothetical protein